MNKKRKTKRKNRRKKIDRSHKIKESLIMLWAMLFLVLGFFIIRGTITGFVVLPEEKSYSKKLDLTFTESSDYTFELDELSNLKSVKVSGSIIGNGSVKVYLEKDAIKYLIYETQQEQGLGLITGHAVEDINISDNQTIEINETINQTEEVNETIEVNETNQTEPVNETIEPIETIDITDITPPNPVTNVHVVNISSEGINIAWNNPEDEDFAGVKILRKINAYPNNNYSIAIQDDIVEITPNLDNAIDTNFEQDRVYFYSVYSYDNNQNFALSQGTFIRTGSISVNETKVNETVVNETIINETIENKTIEINLEYKSGTKWDPDNDGIETTSGVIDFTVESSLFNFDVDESNICTRWTIYSKDNNEVTAICYGSNACCNNIGLNPLSANWNDVFELYYTGFGSGLSNKVIAQIIYEDIYSEQSELDGVFTEQISYFNDECDETCLIDIETNDIKLVIELNNVILVLDNLTYNILEIPKENNPPILIANISNITISKEHTLDLSNYFYNPDNDILTYEHYKTDNISVVFDNNIAIITPDSGFTGTRYMYFIANDSKLAAVSNVFKITVIEEEELEQLQAEIGKPVKWIKKSKKKIITVPDYASNIEIDKIVNDRKIKLEKEKIKIKQKEITIEEDADSYEITYETPAPQLREEKLTKNTKQIVVYSDISYKDIRAHTNFKDVIANEDQIKLYHIVDNQRIETSFELYDDDNNGLVDSIQWVVPHLSNQTYEVDITNATIIENPSINMDRYGYNSTTGVMTDNNGLRFKRETNGVININDERYLGFAIRGNVGGTPYTYTSMDLNWNWHAEQDGDDYIFWAENDNANFKWKQYYKFYKEKNAPMKVENSIENNMANIENATFYYLFSVKGNDQIEYNNTKNYFRDIGTIYRKGNFTGLHPTINFNGQYDFNFEDIIEKEFEITEFYAGSGDIIGYPNINITAIGFTKNKGKFPMGSSVSIDPTFSSNTVEGIAMAPINETAFAMVWCDETEDDITFAVYDAAGTVIRSAVDLNESIGGCPGGEKSVDVDCYNSTHCAVTYYDSQNIDATYMAGDWSTISSTVYDSFGDMETGVSGGVTAVAVLNSTHAVYGLSTSTVGYKFEVRSIDGTQVGTDTTLTNIAKATPACLDIDALNSSVYTSVWISTYCVYNTGQDEPNYISYAVHGLSGGTITPIITDTVIQKSLNAESQVAVAALNSTNAVVVFRNASSYDLQYNIHDTSNFVRNGTIEILASSTPIGVDALNKTHFVVVYSDGIASTKMAIADVDENVILSPTAYETTLYSYIGVAAFRTTSGLGFCNRSYIVASSSGNWYANTTVGSEWGGTCPPDVSGPTISGLNTNATNSTSKNEVINLSAICNDGTAAGQIWYSMYNDSIYWNSTPVDYVNNQIYTFNITIEEPKGTDINLTIYCNDTYGNEATFAGWIGFTIGNSIPTHTTPSITTPSGFNISTENVTCSNQSTSDLDGDNVTNIYNWYKDGESITLLNMPFDTNASLINRTKDYSGGNNNGTINPKNPIPYWNSSGCIKGGCYTFNATNGPINITNLTNVGSKFTVSAWATMDGDRNGVYPIMISKWHDDPGREFLIGYHDISEVMYFQIYDDSDDSTCSVSSDFKPTFGEWFHVAASYDGEDTIKIYINGQLNKTATGCTGDHSTAISHVTIGTFDTSGTNNIWNGSIDEVIIFNRTLTADQIYQIHMEGNGSITNSTITSSETSSNETWTCSVTPNDAIEDGVNLTNSAYIRLSAQTDCDTYKCIIILDNSGTNITIIDSYGNIDLRGSLTQSSTASPNGNDFIVKNSSDEAVLWVDDSGGNMYIFNTLNENQDGACDATPGSFIVRNSSDECVVFINKSGHLWLNGDLQENVAI